MAKELQFEEGAAEQQRPSVCLQIPVGKAVIYVGGQKKEGTARDQEIEVPYPESTLPTGKQREKAEFFLNHVKYLVTEKKYKYLGHKNFGDNVIASELDRAYGKAPEPVKAKPAKPAKAAKTAKAESGE